MMSKLSSDQEVIISQKVDEQLSKLMNYTQDTDSNSSVSLRAARKSISEANPKPKRRLSLRSHTQKVWTDGLNDMTEAEVIELSKKLKVNMYVEHPETLGAGLTKAQHKAAKKFFLNEFQKRCDTWLAEKGDYHYTHAYIIARLGFAKDLLNYLTEISNYQHDLFTKFSYTSFCIEIMKMQKSFAPHLNELSQITSLDSKLFILSNEACEAFSKLDEKVKYIFNAINNHKCFAGTTDKKVLNAHQRFRQLLIDFVRTEDIFITKCNDFTITNITQPIQKYNQTRKFYQAKISIELDDRDKEILESYANLKNAFALNIAKSSVYDICDSAINTVKSVYLRIVSKEFQSQINILKDSIILNPNFHTLHAKLKAITLPELQVLSNNYSAPLQRFFAYKNFFNEMLKLAATIQAFYIVDDNLKANYSAMLAMLKEITDIFEGHAISLTQCKVKLKMCHVASKLATHYLTKLDEKRKEDYLSRAKSVISKAITKQDCAYDVFKHDLEVLQANIKILMEQPLVNGNLIYHYTIHNENKTGSWSIVDAFKYILGATLSIDAEYDGTKDAPSTDKVTASVEHEYPDIYKDLVADFKKDRLKALGKISDLFLELKSFDDLNADNGLTQKKSL